LRVIRFILLEKYILINKHCLILLFYLLKCVQSERYCRNSIIYCYSVTSINYKIDVACKKVFSFKSIETYKRLKEKKEYTRVYIYISLQLLLFTRC